MSEEVERPSAWTLALAFNKLAFESFGGGLAAWAQRMIVEERRWLTEEEYLSASTLCGVLPGANQVNMAVFVGTRFRGALGAAAALTGLIALPAFVALAAGVAYLAYKDVPAVKHTLSGMSCAAAGLTLSVAWKQGSRMLHTLGPVALATATFALAAIVRAPLWLTVAILGPLGFLWAWHGTRKADHAVLAEHE